MDGVAETDFFDLIPFVDNFADLTNVESYRPLPDGWVLAIADVIDSTRAIEKGKYKAVNTAGASVITALLNGLGRQTYPFVFGGDGAMLALPGDRVSTAQEILATLTVWVSEALQLTLRAAIVPVQDIRDTGLDVLVARHRASENATYAMFSGGGSHWAEAQMKKGLYSVVAAAPGSRPDLTGLSCRWDPIPARNGEIVSLIVAPGVNGRNPEFNLLLTEIISIVAEQERDGHPLPVDGPPLTLTTKGIDSEARATAAEGRLLMRKLGIFAETMLAVGIDYLGVPVGSFDPKRYKVEVAENSDFRKFDDSLKMTVDLDTERTQRLEQRLVRAASAGTCRYGIHRQSEALMTCFVPSLHAKNHVHFVDGANGGYALAARSLKEWDLYP
ncbi:adenylate cyclase [Rhizobium sp. Leaf391]|uniref:DUF3095 domain-containing protein n=1 Tax=Rhizobium sp. Leaf391 TaxID=1736360 RepID=UPI000713979A|nr:DUF3095 domain-containing protein [Rhizobium sp. Leaf391]KQT02835.1 adenylate cyclase [Rhizobium sp. Leaf391]